MKNQLNIFSILLVLVLFSSCKKEEIVYNKILGEPELQFSADTLIFNSDVSQTLFLTATNGTVVNYEVTSKPDWVYIYPFSGELNNSIDELFTEIYFHELENGQLTGYISFESNIGNDSVFVKAIVGEHNEFYIPDSIVYTIGSNSEVFTIRNTGNAVLNYELSTNNPLLSIASSTGSIDTHDEQEIVVSLAQDSLATGTYFSNIFVKANDVYDTIGVRIEALTEEKYHLASNVIDAEYSKEKDKIIFISSDPSRVNIFDPVAQDVESISLSYSPNCISIALDGETAIVGHDNYISYVDLSSLSVISVIDIPHSAVDIVLSPNKWAYVFPEEDYNNKIQCVNLETNQQFGHIGEPYYQEGSAKLHPDGNYIYLANRDVEKYDISEGVASFMYDDDNYNVDIDEDLWFFEDGSRFITAAGNILKSSENQSDDMMYSGSLEIDPEYSYTKIAWFVSSSVNSEVYLIKRSDSNNHSYIKVFDGISLVHKTDLELEKYYVTQSGGAVYEAEPYFVFSHKTENRIYVVTKAVESGMVNEWGIEQISFD